MLLLLQDLKGDSFDIPSKFTKLWVDNCPDFKTVPAHIIELNVRNCASFNKVPKTVQYLAVYNCPLLDKNKIIEKQITAMNHMIAEKFKTKINTTPAVKFKKHFFNQRSIEMQNEDMKEALKDVNMEYRKDKIFIEVLNLRAYVARLLRRVDELESAASNNG